MPEENGQQQGAQQDQGRVQSQDQGRDQSQQQQVQDPRWLSMISDEAAREEARKGWMQSSDYTRKTQELAEQRKAWEEEKGKYAKQLEGMKQYQEFYEKQYVPLVERMKPHWSQIEAILSGAQPAAPSQQNGQPPQSGFENWDLLSPQEQVAKLTEHFQGSYLQPTVKGLEERIVKHLQDREQYYQNQINILVDAMERKTANPDLKLREFMQEAVKIHSGNIDPLELAYKNLTQGAELEKLQKQWMDQGRKDYEQELKNKQHDSGALVNTVSPVTRSQPKSRAEIEAFIQQKAREANIPW